MKSTSRILHTATALAALAPLGAFAADTPAKRAPNVIVIIADDLGYGDISAYKHGKLHTPNIDKLAAEGMRFTDGYAPGSTCTPSRYGLMTGEFPWRKKGTGILPGDAKLIISPSRTTLPRIFNNAGYATAAVGKWHLGLGDGPEETDFNKHIAPGLNELGFTYSFHMAATGDRVPCVFMENGYVVGLDTKDPIRVSYKKKVGDWPTLNELRGTANRAGECEGEENAKVGVRKGHRVNNALVRMQSDVGHADTIINGIGRIGFMCGGKAALWDDRNMSDTFTGKVIEFIDKNKDKPFFIYYAAHEPHVPRDPHPRFVGKSGMGPRGDAILQFDDSVARIMAKLKETGVDDNTLVILSSDNGPAVSDGYDEGAKEGEKAAGHDASGGLKGGKYGVHEGGFRVPFIARWPGHIKPGTISPTLVNLADMPAFAADLTGQTLAPDAAPDSISFLPVLTGKATQAEPYLLLGNSTATSIREGKWKLLPGSQRGKKQKNNDTGPVLIDLEKDPGETTNVAKQNPQVVSRLAELHAQAVERGFTRPGAKPVDIR